MRPTDERMHAFDKIMALGEDGIRSLTATNPSFEAMFGPSGLVTAMSDPEVMATFTPEQQRGAGLMFGFLNNSGAMYSGCPVRVEGRTIGTFCCLFMDRSDEMTEAETEIQRAHAASVGALLSSLSDLTEVGGSPNPRNRPQGGGGDGEA